MTILILQYSWKVYFLEATNRVKVDGGIRVSMLMEDWLDNMQFQVLEPWSKQRDPAIHLHNDQ